MAARVLWPNWLRWAWDRRIAACKDRSPGMSGQSGAPVAPSTVSTLHFMARMLGLGREAEILAVLGSRARDLDVIFETTLEQLTGLLEMVARYGDQAGDATAPLPESLARQVEHIRVIAQEMARSLSVLRPSHGPAVPGVVQDGMLTIPTYQSVWGFVEAIHNATIGKGWTDGNGATAPMYRLSLRHAGEMYVSYRGPDDDVRPRDEVRSALWAQVRQLDDLESDTLLVCLAHWATHSKGPDEAVWVNVNAILDARNVQPKRYAAEGKRWTHGHRQEDRSKLDGRLRVSITSGCRWSTSRLCPQESDASRNGSQSRARHSP
jgi:hypothetical protein